MHMQWQANWVRIMNPVASLLKFRLPYPDRWPSREFSYLDGTVYKQVWSTQTGTETRLVPDLGRPLKNWDIVKYEHQMFYHNLVMRERTKFANPFGGTEPIDPPELINDYDSMAEAVILRDYLRKFRGNATQHDVVQMSRAITAMLNEGVPRNNWKTLSSIRADPDETRD